MSLSVRYLLIFGLLIFSPDGYSINIKSLISKLCSKKVEVPRASISMSKIEKKNFEENLSYMNISNEVFTNRTNFGDPEEWSSYFDYLFSRFQHLPAEKSFRNILIKKYDNKNQLKTALNKWGKEHGGGIEFLFPDDILGEVMKNLDKLPTKIDTRTVISPNGFINNSVYSLLSSEKKILIADPHDILMHVGSYVDPIDNKLINDFMKLNDDVFSSVGYAGRRTLDTQNDYLKAKNETLNYLFENVRNSTHENYTYIKKDMFGDETLFVQGNAPFNGLINIRQGSTDGFVDRLLYFNNPKNGDLDDHYEKIKSLPYFENFLKSNIKNKKNMRLLKESLETMSMTPTKQKKAHKKLTQMTKEVLNQFPDRRVDTANTEQVAKFFRELTVKINKDKDLRKMFTKQNRQESLRAQIEVIRSYNRWVDEGGIPKPIEDIPTIGQKPINFSEISTNLSNDKQKIFDLERAKLNITNHFALEYVKDMNYVFETIKDIPNNEFRKIVKLLLSEPGARRYFKNVSQSKISKEKLRFLATSNVEEIIRRSPDEGVAFYYGIADESLYYKLGIPYKEGDYETPFKLIYNNKIDLKQFKGNLKDYILE